MTNLKQTYESGHVPLRVRGLGDWAGEFGFVADVRDTRVNEVGEEAFVVWTDGGMDWVPAGCLHQEGVSA